MKKTGSAKRTATNPPSPSQATACNRRHFVAGLLGAGAVLNIGSLGPYQARAAELGPLNSNQRSNTAYRLRADAARAEMQLPLPDHPDNGDEALYPNKIASFSKGLPHDDLGEVDFPAYQALLRGLSTGNPADFEAIPMGCPNPAVRRKLENPQSGLAYDLEGADSHALAMPPAPRFSSAEAAGEIIENYWMALTRDVPFAEYDTNALTQFAAADLSKQLDFRGPHLNGTVTPGTLFRGISAGCLAGPYISQFLWQHPPYGATWIDPRMQSTLPGVDFMTQYPEWLRIQRGYPPTAAQQYATALCYIRNGRDLAQWVHMDLLYESYFNAMLCLLGPASRGGMQAPLNPGNPYLHSQTQIGFGTFGPPHVSALMAEVAARATKAVWYQKWFVHRRLRPEVYAGRIHNHLTGVHGAARYPLPVRDLNRSQVLSAIYEQYGTYLLPMAFPEGSPLHPSYGEGHATAAAACTTILKAWFDENFVIPHPVQATPDGLELVPYIGEPLTVGGELNKLVNNIGLGRDIAGVHWRSDAAESLRLGEAVAISILRDQRPTYTENFTGFTFTTFDGRTVTV